MGRGFLAGERYHATAQTHGQLIIFRAASATLPIKCDMGLPHSKLSSAKPVIAPTATTATSLLFDVSANDVGLLRTFVQQTTQLDPHQKPGPQLAKLVQSVFQVEAVAIYDADLREIDAVGDWFDDLKDTLQNICVFDTSNEDGDTGLIRRVLRMGKMSIGAMQIRGDVSAITSDIIATVIAITFDRYHVFANESRIESARRTELLRTTVLDSLAHAYKTPLTAIEAASTGLAAMGNLSPAQAELVALIDEQSRELAHLTNQLLMTAKLEASDLIPRVETVAIMPLLDDVIASLKAKLSGFVVEVSVSRDDLIIHGDRNLLIALLTQYLDNAGKYADTGSRIVAKAEERSDAIVVSIRSFGPRIPVSDHERIFDRYYRSSTHAGRAPGTGIGLSIAKRAAQAHGGHVWVTSDSRGGTVFYASLPQSAQEIHE
jgi:two-component system sensor histidine kinase KdpD